MFLQPLETGKITLNRRECQSINKVCEPWCNNNIIVQSKINVKSVTNRKEKWSLNHWSKPNYSTADVTGNWRFFYGISNKNHMINTIVLGELCG